MNQQVERQAGGLAIGANLPAWLRRLWPVAPVWLVAAAVDLATGQRYSAVWGSVAIVITVAIAFPVVRPALTALGGYGAVWVVFNLARAVADDLPLAVAGEGSIAGLQRALFGGALPSAWAQARWFDRAGVGAHDIALSIVHGSFFVVPFAMAMLLWWRQRALFGPYLVATAIIFALGTVGFVLLPTSPPWMSDPGEVARVAHLVLAETAGIDLGSSARDASYWFEPNALAAMPSMHVAATVLVFLVARRIGRIAGLLGGLYAVVMTVAVVYLGEHFVLDALLGWAIAVAGWWAAHWMGVGGRYQGTKAAH